MIREIKRLTAPFRTTVEKVDRHCVHVNVPKGYDIYACRERVAAAGWTTLVYNEDCFGVFDEKS